MAAIFEYLFGRRPTTYELLKKDDDAGKKVEQWIKNHPLLKEITQWSTAQVESHVYHILSEAKNLPVTPELENYFIELANNSMRAQEYLINHLSTLNAEKATIHDLKNRIIFVFTNNR